MTRPLAVSRAALALLAGTLVACAPRAPESAVTPVRVAAPAPPDRDYLVYVGSEGDDRIALVRFGPGGARIDHEIVAGMMPADVDGPHGMAVSPDGRYYYVSTAHGTPYGYLWKYTTGTDSLVGRVMLGSFPATTHVSPDGAFVYVVNFNLHGEMVPSSMSIVAADEMLEVARPRTCTMPHGSRVNPQGTKQYSACMMDDMLVEIDTRTFGVSRHFMLATGSEHGMPGAPGEHAAMQAGEMHAGMDMSHSPAPSCSPTWAQPSADGAKIFVACNKSSEIVEVDAGTWTMTRRWAAGPGVYNLAVTHDGKLLVGTNKRGPSVSVFDLATGKELARIPGKRRVSSGVTISADDRYAFVTDEGVGSEPGTVEVIDLRALQTVATVDVGQQAGGIDFWKTEPAR